MLADPELTVDLPAAITAATGIDALTHNIEAYLAKGYNPICDGIALEGLRLGAANLARAVAQPHDLEAGRHADELDDGRHRLPEGPRARALHRPRARARWPTCTTAWPTR